ncbi:hypothetical protein RS130_14855 [Paraglaciecola aquimarina]|uniref:Tripartite tricarboxylate transporter TctB family protein n=1 Tax=Paraglaciecola aquimarina TaxID=1235557 RepID=A0ABU3SYC5_9ALTE|nr:hypothetical protein [Paraglaciecola aquimarina]MDU0355012.1 hypothetical protein [Paraglaciecola aquimarina]
MTEHDANTAKNRQYDFKFAVVLLLILAYLLTLTLSFPMSGNYGGVENQWYVSPALFPLLLLAALFLCCTVLLISAVRQNGTRHFFSVGHWLGDHTNQLVLDRWLIIGLLIEFVYVLVPSTDFYLATTVFVASLTSIFYLQLAHSRKWVVTLNMLLTLVLVITRLVLNEDSTVSLLDINDLENSILYCDIFVALTLFILLTWQLNTGFAQQKTKVLYHLIAVLFVPLVLVMIFSFLLYVPMPVEYGTVISFLNWLVYQQLGI